MRLAAIRSSLSLLRVCFAPDTCAGFPEIGCGLAVGDWGEFGMVCGKLGELDTEIRGGTPKMFYPSSGSPLPGGVKPRRLPPRRVSRWHEKVSTTSANLPPRPPGAG